MTPQHRNIKKFILEHYANSTADQVPSLLNIIIAGERSNLDRQFLKQTTSGWLMGWGFWNILSITTRDECFNAYFARGLRVPCHDPPCPLTFWVSRK